MTLSTLIAELQKLQAMHGDLPVTNTMENGPAWDRCLVCVALDSAEYCDCHELKGQPHIHLS